MKELTIRIEGATYEGGALHLVCSPAEGIRAVHAIERGKKYDLSLHKEKRSLSANAYAWTLINKISAKIHEPPVVVYRRYVRDIGGKRSVCEIPIEDIELETQEFIGNHLGRLVQVTDGWANGYATMVKVYGSSSFDRKQMAAFIDQIIQDAQALGIETRDPNEIESLLQSWGKR